MKTSHQISATLFALFVIIHDPAGDYAAFYDGMSQATVASLITQTGKTFNFVDQPTYEAFVLAHQPAPLTPAELLALQRADAVNYLNKDPQAVSKLQRAILLVIMDELNILRQRDRDRATDVAAALSLSDLKVRWALRSTLTDSTATQAKTAVENKLNSGASD